MTFIILVGVIAPVRFDIVTVEFGSNVQFAMIVMVRVLDAAASGLL